MPTHLLSPASCLLALAIILLASCTMAGSRANLPAPPPAPKHPVTDSYHGVAVTDDYRWLENWDDPAVKQWSAAQNARSRAYFDALPNRPAIKARLHQLIAASSPSYYDLQFRGNRLFAEKNQPPLQQPLLITRDSADNAQAAEKIVFNPNTESAKGSYAVDFFVPSLDGKYVAAAISENGSEDSAVHIFETATGRELPDRVPRVNFATAGGSLDWNADSTGFYYTRYPQGNERPPEDANFYQQIYFHKLGSDSRQDTYILGKDFPRIAEIALRTSDDGKWLVVTVANGDGGEFAHYLMDSAGRWTQITHFNDAITSVKVASDGTLFLLSHKNAPRGQILHLPPLPAGNLNLAAASILIPQSIGGADENSRASIEGFELSKSLLYVVDMMGGPSRLRVFDFNGTPLRSPTLPAISAIGQIVPLSGPDALFQVSSYLEPPAWYHYSPTADGGAYRTALIETAPFNFDDAQVTRAFATSKDGTKIPLNIISRKNTVLNGHNPTLLYGYGGYNISMEPGFAGAATRIWLDQGGVYVVANIRGGGEYGEEWHTAGNLTRKQNVFDDFLAAAHYLVDHHYTSPEHLAIRGGSNGGLLMGAALTQAPRLFSAVVSQVGIYDMLRVELDPNGAFNTTEFGTVKNPDQFRALFAYSPYHHVHDGTPYPAVLFMTGENDHRVNPMQSRKMTARLQAATSSGRPILLRTSATAGHGIGTALDEEIDQSADIFSFLFDQLGMRYTPPK